MGEEMEDEPETVLFPTPPFPLATTTTFLTPGIFDFLTGPSRGIVGGRLPASLLVGRPYARRSKTGKVRGEG